MGERFLNAAMHQPPADYGLLADQLSALAYPARLELLEILKIPHLVSEIRLTPQRIGPGENPDRPAAKATVQAHLEKLHEAEFLHVENVGSEARKVHRFSVNVARLYSLVEDLRRVSTIYAGRAAPKDATGTLAADRAPARVEGPRLILAHGVYEGKNFSFTRPPVQPGGWIIGRRLDADVALDYDGYVSSDHAEVTRAGSGHYLRDLRSKNGTFVNWVPLKPDELRLLEPGDIIGTGRSLLVFKQN